MNIVESLRELIGAAAVLDAADTATRSAGVWRPDNLQAAALARPASTQEVAKVMAWCHANDVSVVTHGGLTGLVHGADAGPEPNRCSPRLAAECRCPAGAGHTVRQTADC